MGSRRQAREVVMQGLFQLVTVDSTEASVLEALLVNIKDEFAIDDNTYDFAKTLFHGVVENLNTIDSILNRLAEAWNFDRLAKVDKAILRLGVFEILNRDDIPDAVTINEAIELAKTYSTNESGKFINGILGNLANNKDQYSQKP